MSDTLEDATALQDLRYENLDTGAAWYDPVGNLLTIKNLKSRLRGKADGTLPRTIYYDTAVRLTGAGVSQSELRYKPWGETRYTDGSPPTQRQFTGQVNESALGLYFFNARWYDPV